MFEPGMLVEVEGYKGIAFVIDNQHTEIVEGDIWEDDNGYVYVDWPEELLFPDVWDCHMKGDDTTFFVHEDDIIRTLESVCSCGQIGCGWEV